MREKNKQVRLLFSNLLLIVYSIIVIVVLLSFLYYLFNVASFSASVKNTVETSCKTIVSIFEDNSTDAEKLTVEELRSATNYIIEASEYYSVASNNNLISIIYAFATTVILSAGAFLLGKISKKSESLNDKLTVFNGKADVINKEIENTEARMEHIKNVYSKLLDLQNITSYMLYANLLINECENNLKNHTDNFKLLNDIVNKLKMIPNEYRDIVADDMEVKFGGDLGCPDFGKSLYFNFVEFKDNYKGLIKRYVEVHSEKNKNYKKKYIETQYESINDIINDIMMKQNSSFYEIS